MTNYKSQITNKTMVTGNTTMQKKIPQRMCLGCREMKAKSELVRVVKSPEGEVSLDITGKKPGRGAYVCRNPDCFKRVVKSNALARAFKAQISNEIIEVLQNQLEK